MKGERVEASRDGRMKEKDGEGRREGGCSHESPQAAKV